MKLVITEFFSLDGVMEGPGSDDPFKNAGWTMAYNNAEFGKFKLDEILASDALLLGRVTYEGFAKAWPGRTDDAGFADKMNSMPKFVVSDSLSEATWNNTTIIGRKDAVQKIKELKTQPGNDLLVAGSSVLAQMLFENDLVDELRLLVYPVVLGEGKRLFKDGTRAALKLIEAKPFETGVVLLKYAPTQNA